MMHLSILLLLATMGTLAQFAQQYQQTYQQFGGVQTTTPYYQQQQQFGQQPRQQFGTQQNQQQFGQQPQQTPFGQQPQQTPFGQQPQQTSFGQQPNQFATTQQNQFGQPNRFETQQNQQNQQSQIFNQNLPICQCAQWDTCVNRIELATQNCAYSTCSNQLDQRHRELMGCSQRSNQQQKQWQDCMAETMGKPCQGISQSLQNRMFDGPFSAHLATSQRKKRQIYSNQQGFTTYNAGQQQSTSDQQQQYQFAMQNDGIHCIHLTALITYVIITLLPLVMDWLGQVAQSFGFNSVKMWQSYGECLGQCLNQTLGASSNNRNYFRDDTRQACANQLNDRNPQRQQQSGSMCDTMADWITSIQNAVNNPQQQGRQQGGSTTFNNQQQQSGTTGYGDYTYP